jgi:putative peptidoglycan lipid II flippase
LSAPNLLKSAKLIGLLTLVSRVLGLVRDVAITHAFGVGSVSSAFWTAFQIPNLFRRLFGEGALSAASIPVLTETLAREGSDAADRLAGRLVALLLTLLTVLCVAGEVVVAVLYWRYRHDSDSALVLGLTGLMLPYMVFICTAAMLGGIQNVFHRFGSAAAAPIIMNLFMIASAVITDVTDQNLRSGAMLLGLAVVVSGIFQMAWQWAASRRIPLRLPLSLSVRDEAVQRIGRTMLPMLAGLATIQINTLLGSLIAWWMVPEEFAPGATSSEKVGPAVLNVAQRLYQFPLGVFTTALATAIFPLLSRHAAEKDHAQLSGTLTRGLRVASFEGIPCLVGLILVGRPLIETFFAHGEFRKWPDATDRVTLSLTMYSLGIWAFGVNQLIVRAFYAMKDARTPLWISVWNVGLNLVLNVILVKTALLEAGLALATTICAMVQIAVLLWRFHRDYARLHWGEWGRSLVRVLIASGVMGVLTWWVGRLTADQRAVYQLMLMVAVGAATYIAAAWVLRSTELREMFRRG